MRRRLSLLLLFLVVVVPAEAQRRRAAFQPDVPVAPSPVPPRDPFSAAEPGSVRSTHLDLDLTVDFDTKRIRGSVTHTIENLNGSNRFLVDARNLSITGVTTDGSRATYTTGSSPRLGQPLTITITPSTRKVKIDYTTSAGSNGLVWHDAPQTIGGVSPFVYSFAQPDNGREWIPMQDTPGVRTTYTARIRVPRGLFAVMSGNNVRTVEADGIYDIDMPYPIPSYLIALAVGRLEFHEFSDRTGFYAEPEMVQDAAWDMQFLPQMLAAAEKVMGPYPFARYDVLVMPPGFLAGGMENPMINFLAGPGVAPGNGETPPTPSDVLAHELAHSWAGDATTCATWSDTWLNEGFATYYAKRILEEMMGPERGEIGFYWERGNYESYHRLQSVQPKFKTLHREFSDTDNLSIFNTTNYSKGAIFLKTIEDHLGRERFDAILQSYFRRYKFRWADDRSFVDELKRGSVDTDALLIDQWLYTPELPSNLTAPTRAALWDRIGVQSQRYRSGTPVAGLDVTGWTDFHLSLFLWQISDAIAPRIAEIDAVFHVSQMKTASVHWYLAVAATRYEPAMPMFDHFMTYGGSNVMAVYQYLAQTSAGRTWGREIFDRVKIHYSANLRESVQQILGITRAVLAPAA